MAIYQLRTRLISCFHPLTQLRKHCFFTLIAQLGQKMLKCRSRVGMHSIFSRLQIFQRRSVGIGISLVDLAGCNPIAEHFRQITAWNRYRNIHALLKAIVRPVFPMMAIPSLVMHPGQRIPLFTPFILRGRMRAVKVADTLQEFRRAVFGKIVAQALPEDSSLGAVPNHLMTVARHRAKMPKESLKSVHTLHPTCPASSTLSATAPPRQTSP